MTNQPVDKICILQCFSVIGCLKQLLIDPQHNLQVIAVLLGGQLGFIDRIQRFHGFGIIIHHIQILHHGSCI